jgi:hypothetical protein
LCHCPSNGCCVAHYSGLLFDKIQNKFWVSKYI